METVTLSDDPQERKAHPVATGVLDYFPKSLWEIAGVSYLGSKQHNGDAPLRWDRSKSTDEADALIRHFLQRGTRDSDGTRHTAKMAWRALALLEKEIEAEQVQSALDRASLDLVAREFSSPRRVCGCSVCNQIAYDNR